MESNLLQTFWNLSSIEEGERVEAAKDLITLIEQRQTAHGEGVCAELDYAVKRLVKGLSSNRKGARCGFYTALAQILRQFPQEVSVSHVLELVHAHLQAGGGAKAAEEKGACFGKGFAMLALVCSGVLSSKDDFVTVAKELVSLGKKKSFLQEFCASIICQLLEVCPMAMCRDHVIHHLDLERGWAECTTEQLQVLLHLSKLYNKEKWFCVFLNRYWVAKHIWSRKNLEVMKTALLGSSSALPRLHSVWPLVLGAVRDKGHFGEFWRVIVDGGLVTSSHERKYVSFQLLAAVLPSLSVQEVGVVFSPNLLSCLMNNSQTPHNYLHPAARHLLEELCRCVGVMTDQRLLSTLLTHLQHRTDNKFDRLMGSKIVELLISKLDVVGVDCLLETYHQLIIGPLEGEGGGAHTIAPDGDDEQLWGVGQVLGVVRNSRLPRKGPWLISAATLLLGHAFFAITDPCTSELPSPLAPPTLPLEPSVRESCQLKFLSVLTDLSSMALPREDREGVACGQSRYPPGMTETGEHFVTVLFQVAQKLVVMSESSDTVRPLHPLSSKERSIWDKAYAAVQALSSKSSLEMEDRAFLVLYSVSGLGLLPPGAAERERHCQTITELEACRDELEKGRRRKLKGHTPSKKQLQESKWMEVMIDLLLGLLSQPSQLWRNTVEQAFKFLTGHVTSEGLQLILAVLKPKQAAGEVMEGEEDQNEEDDSDEMEEEKEEDNSEEEEEDALDVEADSDSSGDDGVEEVGGVDPVFAESVRRALGAAAAMGSDEESEDSPDDEAMMAVDKALGEVFRTRFALKHQKKQQKDDEQSLLHFKLRVLDLVEVFLQKEPTNPLIFELIMPLYEVVHASQSTRSHAPLVDRAVGIFLSRLCHAKVYPKTGLDYTDVHEKLQQLVQCLYKVTAVTSPLATAGCMFLIRVLRGSAPPPFISPVTTRAGRKRKQEERGGAGGGEGVTDSNGRLDVSLVTQWLEQVLHDFITVKNSSIPPSFFTTYIQRYSSLAGLLLPTMIRDLPAAANHFKKTQVHEMVAVLLSGEEGKEGVWEGLTPEDAAAIDTIMAKGGKRKRTKRRKSKKTRNV